MFAALAEAGVIATLGCSDDDAAPVSGDGVFQTDLSPFTTTQPVKRSAAFVTFGSVALRQRSGHPVTLVSAKPIWSDRVTVSSIRISPYERQPVISAADFRIPGAVDVAGFVVPAGREKGPDGNDELYLVTTEVRLDPDAEAGLVLGLDVTYRDGGDVRTQRFLFLNMLCHWPDDALVPCPTTYRGVDVMSVPVADLVEQIEQNGGVLPPGTATAPPTSTNP